VKIVLSCVEIGGPVSVSEAHTGSDGIMDPKRVLVTWNQADNTRRQITKLSHFVEAGRSNSSTGRMRLWSDQLVTEPVSVSEAYTASDGIMDQKLVLVTWNQADKLQKLLYIKLRDFLKARRGNNNNTVVNSSHRSSHRTRHPARSLDGGANTAPVHIKAFPNDVSKLFGADPFFTCRFFICVRSHGDVRSLEDSANLGAVATRGLVSDQSTSAFLESPCPSRLRGKVIMLDFDYNAVLETTPPSVLKLPVD
jgi:hypothetical protein